MSRIRNYPNGSFAIKMTRNVNLWFSYSAGTNIDEAIKDAGARAMEYDNDYLEAKLQGISVERYRQQKWRTQRNELRQIVREFMRDEMIEADAPEPVELVGKDLIIARRNTEQFFSRYIG